MGKGVTARREATARARVLRLEHAGMFREQQGGQGGWSGVEGHSYEGRSAKKWGPLSFIPHIQATKNYLGSLKAVLSLISCCCTAVFSAQEALSSCYPLVSKAMPLLKEVVLHREFLQHHRLPLY